MATTLATKDRADGRARRVAIVAILLGLAIAALLIGLSLRQRPRIAAPHPVSQLRRRPALPVGAPPPVEPTVLAALTADQARASNAAVPFAAGKPPQPSHYVYAGSPQDRSAALTCLAAAVLYEAGDDATGEQAVAQVVVNRLRHPAFPKTVCGVVFQGSDRSTGCQFTFTCDGALDRPPRPAAWARARAIADAALAGHVDAAVGTATHYHTDWVVPYWRDTLVKLAKVGTQIFYRWSGGWGAPQRFVGQAQPFERLDPRLVPLAGPDRADGGDMTDGSVIVPDGSPVGAPPRTVVEVAGVPHGALGRNIVRLADPDGRQYVLQLAASASPASYAAAAAALCRDKPDCLVFGWRDPTMMPRRLPILPMGLQGMTYMYRKSSLVGSSRSFWNCRQTPRGDAAECLPGTR